MAERHLAQVALVVGDYDEAIRYFVDTLEFTLVEDTSLNDSGKRWVIVAPGRDRGCRLLLARAATPEQSGHVGNQTGGRVFLFLSTDNFWGDYETFRGRGVEFVEAPRVEDYGTVAVFKDLYGNLWDLVQYDEPIC